MVHVYINGLPQNNLPFHYLVFQQVTDEQVCLKHQGKSLKGIDTHKSYDNFIISAFVKSPIVATTAQLLIPLFFSTKKYLHFSYFSRKTYVVVLNSNGYSQHMFLSRNKKTIYLLLTLI